MRLPSSSKRVRRLGQPGAESCLAFDGVPGVPRPARPAAAFTLVEIALSLAIIGFALVAIIGVLPTGLNVQRDNREETIIVHEANYFLDAIRNGARGLNNLTNSIISITNTWTVYDTNNPTSWVKVGNGYDGYTKTSFYVTSSPQPADFSLTNGYRIIGLLSRPKFEDVGAPTVRSNYVVAYMHALSGAASEKFPVDNPTVLDLAFNYRMIVEVQPVAYAETNTAFARELSSNLRELRLIFRWPLRADGTTGDGRQVFRTMTGGRLVRTNDYPELNPPLYFFEPTTFVNLKAP
jgi:type II secretory pathway pseudopilin PulG